MQQLFDEILDHRTKVQRPFTDSDFPRLANDLKRKEINGAHWFRIAYYWFKVNFGYNNPLNYGNVHSELFLLNSIRNELIPVLASRPIVFLGIGTGDTEMALLDLQLDQNRFTEVIAVDINSEFLDLFGQSLKMRSYENADFRIKYKPIRSYFEDIRFGDIHVPQTRFSGILLTVLGSTIGNYNNTGEFLQMLENFTSEGDGVLLSYQLNHHLKEIFEKYNRNPYYVDLIGNFLSESQKERIKWDLNFKASTVEAWLNDIQIFRSKKFHEDDVAREVSSKYRFRSEKIWVDSYKNMCIHLLMRI